MLEKLAQNQLENGQLVRYQYKKKGFRSGRFREHYENGSLKSKGRFKPMLITEIQQCYDPNTYEEVECKISKVVESKAGNWKYYDEKGKRISANESLQRSDY